MTAALTRLELSRGGGVLKMRPVASTATAEALAQMGDMLEEVQNIVAGLEEGGGGAVTVGNLPATVLLGVWWSGSAWPARPTARTDIPVLWLGGDTQPAGMVVGKDVWLRSVEA